MARQSSTGSGSRNKRSTKAADSVTAEAGELGGDTVVVGESAASEQDANSPVTIESGETADAEVLNDVPSRTGVVDDKASEDATAEDTLVAETLAEPVSEPAPDKPTDKPTARAESAPQDAAPQDSAPQDSAPQDSESQDPAPQVIQKRGPGIVPLLIGGVLAAGVGYAAAFFGLQPTETTPQTDPALTQALATLDDQQGTITSLEAQIAALAGVEPPVIPEVDLSGIEGGLAGVADDLTTLSGQVEALTGRVAALEDRPVFTGEVGADNAAMAAAVDALEARLNTERDASAEAVAAAQAARAEAAAAQAAATAEVRAASEAAQTAIAEAEARAQAIAEATQTQAALSRLQIAMASGAPFADALADLPGDAPAALVAAAETGVPTLANLQSTFPAAARAALPIALRETAGDSAADRAGAFLMGQIGGRSVEPREGDDPDAVLSRAEAAVAAGDLDGALAELSVLPEGAQAAMADWVASVETRTAADAAMAELAATLDN